MTDLPFLQPDPDPSRPERQSRKCRRHQPLRVHFCLDNTSLWHLEQADSGSNCEPGVICHRCYKRIDPAASRRGRNNRKRGSSDELDTARLLGGRKVGQLGLPWDVEVEGYLRVQCKRLASWPSVAEILRWLDAIPAGRELRAVTVCDAPGSAHRARRVIVMDAAEFAAWHGRAAGEDNS